MVFTFACTFDQSEIKNRTFGEISWSQCSPEPFLQPLVWHSSPLLVFQGFLSAISAANSFPLRSDLTPLRTYAIAYATRE